MKPNQIRIVTVSYTPQNGGHCEAVLELTFRNHQRRFDFVVKRTLTGWAKRPTSGKGHHRNRLERDSGLRPIENRAYYGGWLSRAVGGKEEFMDSDGTGISVSHDDGLDFGIVERRRPNGPFATPSRLLIIEHACGYPAVTFVKERKLGHRMGAILSES
jgi:hypothetical protein